MFVFHSALKAEESGEEQEEEEEEAAEEETVPLGRKRAGRRKGGVMQIKEGESPTPKYSVRRTSYVLSIHRKINMINILCY